MIKKIKKSQSLSINVIIVAALALVVLIVLIAIFTGQTRKAVITFESCGGIGGRCAATGTDCDENEVQKSGAKCDQSGQKCCIRVLDSKK